MPTSIAKTPPDDPELPAFLALSSLLTGVDSLDPNLGAVYLQNLRAASASSATVADLLKQAQGGNAALPATLEQLQSSGIFENKATRALADQITQQWYTGIIETPQGQQVVATFIDALAWRTLTFTKPATLCAAFGFWSEPPETALD
jgi:hypothetical protein